MQGESVPARTDPDQDRWAQLSPLDGATESRDQRSEAADVISGRVHVRGVIPRAMGPALRLTTRMIYKEIDGGELRVRRFGLRGTIRIPIAEARRYAGEAPCPPAPPAPREGLS